METPKLSTACLACQLSPTAGSASYCRIVGCQNPLPESESTWVRRALTEIRREDLLADWELAINGQSLFPVDPLR